MNTTPEWEQGKENAAPLERGRNVKALERAALLKPEDKARMIKEHESLVRPSEAPHITEMNSDPLQHWLAYIKFYQDNFPSDSNEQFLLMERCTRALVKMRQYANDDRFIGVCAKYADKTKDPGQIFKFLHQQKVGGETALFWIAWAFVAEKDNDFPFAEQIFKKGIRKNAQPLQMLKVRHQQFQRRMSRHWLNSSETHEQLDGDEEEGETRRLRGVLGGLSRDRVSRNDRLRAPPLAANRARPPITSRRQNQQSNGIFPIFVEQTGENDENGYNLDQSFVQNDTRVLPRDADRRKENTLEAERWNERGGFHSAYAQQRSESQSQTTGPPPPFAVFIDEECVAQHERQEKEQRNHAERKRRERDERTFRQREDAGMAEKLARDPLRYVRNPSKLESDQAKEQQQNQRHEHVSQRGKSERQIRTGFNRRLLKDSNNIEQSFEEARESAGCYTIATSCSSFNLLAVISSDEGTTIDDQRMETDEDVSIEEVSMSESAISSDRPRTDETQPIKISKLNSENKAQRQVLFKSELEDNESLSQTVLSTASSAVDEAHAVGIPMSKEEETINTKFAMKELSMMFSSPVCGTDDAPRKTERSQIAHAASNDDADDISSYANIADLVGHSPRDNSIFVSDEVNNENVGPCNPGARTNATPGFESMVLSELEDDIHLAGSLDCRAQNRRRRLHPAQGDPLRGVERELSNNPGFQIFEDTDKLEHESMHGKARQVENGKQSRPQESDNNGYVSASGEIGNRAPTPDKRSRSAFKILEDKPSVAPDFEIFDDESVNGGNENASNMDRFSDNVSSEVMNSMPAFEIFEDGQDKSPEKPAFEIFKDGTDDRTEVVNDEDETATLSLFGDAFQNLDVTSSNPSPKDSKQNGFDIYVDDPDSTENANSSVRLNHSRAESLDNFPLDDRDVHETRNHNLSITTKDEDTNGFDYQEIHNNDILMAKRHLTTSSFVESNSCAPLFSLLTKVGGVYDLPHLLLPRALRGKSIRGKTEIQIGKHAGVIRNELGRGAYGVVVLMDVDDESYGQTIAVKAQSPTDCLAWEYEVLKMAELRIGARQEDQYPFPRALAFLSLADGGILSMTAGSKSGLNLVDLVNVYKVKLGVPVPEIIALHYTSRMLEHLETLHLQGKILHCDIKPDNFVLSTSDAIDNICEGVDGSELILVDFGRAVDLAKVSGGIDDVGIRFVGNATRKDMSCVAMRAGKPWSFDVDTYGILCSAHVLLYGNHMEVTQGNDGRWKPVSKFRRYWQTVLWTDVFGSLLNMDEASRSEKNSYSQCLRKLREGIDAYLVEQRSQLRSAMARQANLLPSTRDQLH